RPQGSVLPPWSLPSFLARPVDCAHPLVVQQWPPAAPVAGDTLPGQRPVPAAQCGDVQVGNGAVLCEQGALIAPTAGRLGWVTAGEMGKAIQPPIGAQFFF